MSDFELRNRFVSANDAQITRARIQRRQSPINIIDEAYDAAWAGQYVESSVANSYYDYFFSASDIKVYVAELADDEEFGTIPIHNFGFNIEQEKAPVYGYASYTYDATMRGTRLISGQFTLVSRYPDYMKKLLTKAAANRAQNHGDLRDDYPSPAAWRSDDENIERYWGKNLDASAVAQRGSEWSIHPPFSFVIVYGIQSPSISAANAEVRHAAYDGDNALFKNENQRLIESFNPNETSRIVLDGCELVSVARTFSPEMPFVGEVYSFFARDVIVPPANVGNRPGAVYPGSGGAHGGTDFVV